LNLLPAGQLDGGHILRSLNPRLHKWIGLAVPVVLIALGFVEPLRKGVAVMGRNFVGAAILANPACL
jgi:membrane-associated protease RseP (regulator of RpoE activity)